MRKKKEDHACSREGCVSLHGFTACISLEQGGEYKNRDWTSGVCLCLCLPLRVEGKPRDHCWREKRI